MSQHVFKSPAPELESKTLERLRELLVTLPYDLKVLLEAMTDEDLSEEARRLAAGGVIYSLIPNDAIPDNRGVIGFVDDAILMRAVLKRFVEVGGEATSSYPERFADQFANLEEDNDLFRKFFDASLRWIDVRIKGFDQTKYKGKKPADYVANDDVGNMLYEDAMEFTTEYEIDDFTVAKLTSASPILEAFHARSEADTAQAKR